MSSSSTASLASPVASVPTTACPAQPSSLTPTPWQRLLRFCAPYWRSFLLGGLCILTSAYINLLSPQVIRTAVDDLGRGVTQSKIARYAGLVVGIAAIRGCFCSGSGASSSTARATSSMTCVRLFTPTSNSNRRLFSIASGLAI